MNIERLGDRPELPIFGAAYLGSSHHPIGTGHAER
jgi:hypothetical protein